VVVLGPRAEVTAEELRAHCAKSLADYKVPRRIDFADELPRNATGKILKDRLRQSLLNPTPPPVGPR
jgi:fatty-acyl-CoA synthase